MKPTSQSRFFLFTGGSRTWQRKIRRMRNRELRHELPNCGFFTTPLEAQALTPLPKGECNWFRPHRSLCNRPPAPEAGMIATPALQMVPFPGAGQPQQASYRPTPVGFQDSGIERLLRYTDSIACGKRAHGVDCGRFMAGQCASHKLRLDRGRGVRPRLCWSRSGMCGQGQL